MTKVNANNFDQYRQYLFDDIAQDNGSMFNFFFVNNEIFQMVTPEDVKEVNNAYLDYMRKMTNVVIGSYASIIFTNKVMLRNMPKYPNYRITLFAMKYLILPSISYGIGHRYFTNQQQTILRNMSDKYRFGYNEYNRAMDIFERAHRVGRLEELVQKGGEFDWSEVPEFKSKFYSD